MIFVKFKKKSNPNPTENGSANLTDSDLWKSDGIRRIWNPSHP